VYGDNARAGAKGERATAKLLEAWFAAEPDIHVFHDLGMPKYRGDTHSPNIDHVAVRGRNVVVLDSKLWGPGFYWTLRSSHKGLRSFPEADKRTVPMAVDRLTRYLHGAAKPPVSVYGVIIVHAAGRQGRAVQLWALRGPNGTRYRTAAGAEPLVRAMLGRPADPEPEVLRRILALMKVGAG
jgi:hypothetical protein